MEEYAVNRDGGKSGMNTDSSGNLRFPRVAALPVASATYRGCIIAYAQGAGVDDKLYVCMKSMADTYSWVLIQRGD